MKPTYTRRKILKAGALAGAAMLAPFPFNVFAQAVDNANRNSMPTDLRITGVKCGFIRNGAGLFVRIDTNQGIHGWGEGVDAVGGTYHLVQSLGRRLVNRNPLDVHRLFEELRRGGVFGGAQSGMYVAVLSAIETALWDLAGKALGVPVYQLLGGKFRDRVRVYMDTALYQFQLPTPEDFAANAREAVAMGMTAIKFDLDQGNDPARYDRYNWTASPGELQRMVDQMTAAREAVGPTIDICADMHGRYDLPTGKKVAELMEPLNLMWLEEPVPAENIQAYKLINESTSTPICAGENVYLAHGIHPLLEQGAVDIVMPDLQKAGGLGEGQRIANLANLYYVPFAPHMVATYLGAMAATHVSVSVPNFMILEWQIYFHTDPMFQEIIEYDGEMVVDGHIPLSEKPGIGVEMNIEAMRRYAPQGVPFFE